MLTKKIKKGNKESIAGIIIKWVNS